MLQRVAAALATPLLIAACDWGEDLTDVPMTAEDPAEVIYTTWGTPERVQKEDWTLLSFQRNYPAITVNVIAAPTAAEHVSGLYSLFASGSLPDLVHLPSWSAPTFYAEDAVLPLGDYMRRDEFRPDDLTAPFDVCTYQREWVALPRGNNGLYVVFYNRSHFTAASVPLPPPNWTWQDFLTAAQQLTTVANGAAPARWGTTLHGIDEAYHAWLWGNGGDELLNRNGAPAIHEPLAVGACSGWPTCTCSTVSRRRPTSFPATGSPPSRVVTWRCGMRRPRPSWPSRSRKCRSTGVWLRSHGATSAFRATTGRTSLPSSRAVVSPKKPGSLHSS